MRSGVIGQPVARADAVMMRRMRIAAPPTILDGVAVFTREPSMITGKRARSSIPPIPVAAGTHGRGFVLGAGEGMDLIDDITIHRT